MRRRAGFTLLEVIIAMGILAVGATASLALLVSATSTGRRGEHYVNTALIADSVFADVESQLHEGFKYYDLEVCDEDTPPPTLDPVDGPSRIVPPIDAAAVPKTQKKANKKPAPGKFTLPPKNPPAPQQQNGPQAVPTDDPFNGEKPRWLKRDASLPAYPDYKYNVTMKAYGGPPDQPWEFLVEVVVRWSESGKRRSETYQTVLLRRLGQLDNEVPTDPSK